MGGFSGLFTVNEVSHYENEDFSASLRYDRNEKVSRGRISPSGVWGEKSPFLLL